MNNESEDKAEHRTIDACLWNVLIKVCLQLMACINTEDNDKLQLIVTAVASPSSIWRKLCPYMRRQTEHRASAAPSSGSSVIKRLAD